MPWMFRLTYTNPKTGIVSALEADEPEGWDAVEFTIRRSEALPGLTFTFADSMTFADKQGYQLIVQAYENDGIDAEVEAEVLWNDCGSTGGVANEFLWRGLVDYKNYKRQRNKRKVEVGLRENSFTETLLNRIETSVSLEAAASLDGQAITVVPASRIGLHGKRIFQLSAFLVNDFLKTFELTHRMSSSGKGQNEYFQITPPWQVAGKDLDGWREPGYYEPASQNPVFFSGSDFPSGMDFRRITVRFRLKFLFRSLSVRFDTVPVNSETRSHSGEYRFTIGVYDLDDNVKSETTIDAGGYDTFNADAQYDSGERSLMLEVPENCKVVMTFLWRADHLPSRVLNNGRNFTLSGTFDREASFLELSEDSLYPDSTAKAYPVFDAFTNLLHVATGKAAAFRSDYFAIRKGVAGDPAFDGEGGLMFITNGLSLRNMRRKDGGQYPVTCSFKQLFEGLNSIFNLMMAVEYGPGNQPYVRVEPKRFFYRSQVRHAFANASDIVLRPAIEHIFSEVQVGYARWEVEKTNGLDEPNGKRTFVLPGRSQQKQLNLLSRLIAGGYLIEDTRRQQYLEKPTDDFRTDNDTFIIHCGRENPATASERYVSVRGDGSGQAGDSARVFSPESAYNVRLSPARNLLRWMDWFGGCVRKKENPMARFTSGEGNYEARLFGLTENETVPLAGNFLFFPETVTFTYPLSFRAFLALQKDTIFRIGVGCGGETEYEGYILSVEYKPGTRDGGIAEFKLLRAN